MSQTVSSKESPELPQVAKEVVINEGTLIQRVSELAQEISGDYQGRELLVISVSNGAFMFMGDLVRRLVLPVAIEFLTISRYDQYFPAGEIKVLKDVQQDIKDKEGLLIEDIDDTGFTLHYLIDFLSSRSPASLKICTLLDRPDLRLVDIPIQYVGFKVGYEFLIGYGLGYRACYRDLPFIASINLQKQSGFFKSDKAGSESSYQNTSL